MRERAVFLAILAAAAAVSVALVRPRQEPDPTPAPAGAPETSPEVNELPARSMLVPEPPPPKQPPPLPAYVRVDSDSATACLDGMVLVDGIYCPFVGHRCTRYLNEPDDTCQSFAPEVLCEGRLQHRRFCVDIYEYPNMPGVRPAMMINFEEATRACALEGKRLCTVEEWEFACEGTQMWPYPYGLERDKTACNIDQALVSPEPSALANPHTIADAIERVDRRVSSGEMPRCVSPFGARDMTGNVDEWVEDTTAKLENRSVTYAMKGSAWGPGRARCRPIAAPPPASDLAFQVGLRCCADTKGKDKPVSLMPAGARPPRRRMMDRAAP